MAGGHLAAGRVVILDLDEQGEFDATIQAAAQIESLKMARRFPALDRVELYRRAQWRVTLDLLIENPARNAAVVETAHLEIERGQSVLILVAEVEQGERFAAKIEGAVVAHSKMGAKKRREAIGAFRDGSLRCLIATSLADEGLDVPRASVLILATAGRSGAKLEQRTGRVMRPHEGKGVGLVYDFADQGASMARSQGLARRRVYKQLGYQVETVAMVGVAA
jgi:superfamily II DNA or RNA helicase